MAKKIPIWMSGYVPPGFWRQDENVQAYLRWAEKRLGIRRPQDWYKFAVADLQRLSRSGPFRLHTSLQELLMTFRPDYPWKEWLFRALVKGFWRKPENRRRYLDWLGQRQGYERPEDWYQLTNRILNENQGHGLLLFHGSNIRVVKAYMPDYPFKEWLFSRAPVGFWDDPVNQRRYLEWLGEELGFEDQEDWYRFDARSLTRNHGDKLIGLYDGSPSAVLRAVFPEYDWKEWLFATLPNQFWADPDNVMAYMEWLGEQLDFKEPEDWYQVTTWDFQVRRGASLLGKFGGSPSQLVKFFFQDREYWEWLMPRTPRGFWQSRENCGRYLEWLGERLGVVELEDWYRVTADDVEANHGGTILSVHGGLTGLLRYWRPDYDWLEWLFRIVPVGFWDRRKNRRRYLEWLAGQLGLKSPDEWSSITRVDLEQHRGSTLCTRYKSAAAVIRHSR